MPSQSTNSRPSDTSETHTSSSPSPSSSTNKRRRDDLTDDELIDDRGHFPDGRKKPEPSSTPWKAWGKEAARLFNPFIHVTQCADWYLRVKKDKIRLRQLNEFQRRAYDSYILISEHNEDFDQAMREMSAKESQVMLRKMKAGQGSARSDDTHTLKHLIIEMVATLYPDKPEATANLSASNKSNRGFKHPFLGRLICPCNLDWDDPSIREELKQSPSLASTGSWPLFFYPRDQFNPEDLSKGLLQGELLVWAYKAIYLGPSKWKAAEATVSEGCNAKRHRMTSVTLRSIAYVASQVRFALSSGSTNQKTGGAFCLSAFFWNVVKYLEDPMFDTEVEELLQWWNEQIFPEAEPEFDMPEDEDSLQVMKRQRAEKRAALLAKSNLASSGPEGAPQDQGLGVGVAGEENDAN